MSSRYTIIVLLAKRLWKMLFIIAWNVARLLVILKNIIKSLKSLQLVSIRIYLLLIYRLEVDIIEILTNIKLGKVLGILKL